MQAPRQTHRRAAEIANGRSLFIIQVFVVGKIMIFRRIMQKIRLLSVFRPYPACDFRDSSMPVNVIFRTFGCSLALPRILPPGKEQANGLCRRLSVSPAVPWIPAGGAVRRDFGRLCPALINMFVMNIAKLVFNPIQENTYVVWDDTMECVVIDAGNFSAREDKALVDFIVSRGLRPVAAVNTHGHFDHTLGVECLKRTFGVPFMLSGKDRFLLDGASAGAAAVTFKHILAN